MGGYNNTTWATWQLVYDNCGISLPAWGTPADWLTDAENSGYTTGTTPKINSIAVYSFHTAFVTEIDNDQIYIKEGGYMGGYHERWVSATGLVSGQELLGYIYLS